jgi:predicted ATPase/transcriptional regulator with XRE-family HTH domain
MLMATSFGRWLKQRRTAVGLSQDEFGTRVAASGETIRKFEADTRRPSAQVASLIAEFFNIPHNEREAFVTFARLPIASVPHSSDAGVEDTSAPWRSQRSRLTNLPGPSTSLIGREHEVAELQDQLRGGQSRLLTIIGPPGVGKTRLAIAVASTYDIGAEFVDGVYFVPLAPLSDWLLVPSAIASVLGLQESGGTSFNELISQYLAGKRLLLVLDNFEHVMEAAKFIADLLDNCPWLKVVVTSRVPLQIKGERRFSLSTLTVPDVARLPTVAKLLGYSAVRLFVERAQDIDSEFRLVEENAGNVAAICDRLDGLPLAIELAAARTTILPPEALLERLEKSLEILTTGPGHLTPRQRTLRGAIDWSYHLLDDQEKAMLRRLSVFAGGCTLDAIERVAHTQTIETKEDADIVRDRWGEPRVPDAHTLDLVTSLVSKSLLRSEKAEGGMRFAMLYVIKEYVKERLAESGEEESTKHLHVHYFLDLAEKAEPYLTSGERGPWLERLDKEQYNLRAALEWCLSPEGDAHAGLRMAGALGWYWYFRGHLGEGRNWLEQALSTARALRQTESGAKALNAAASLAMYQSDLDVMRALLEESVETWRQLGLSTGLAYACTLLGFVKARKLDSSGFALLEEGVALFEMLGDKWGLAYALNSFGNAKTWTGELTEARSFYQESLDLYQQMQSAWDIAYELGALGRTDLQALEFETARSLLQQALEWEQQLCDNWNVSQLHLDLGSLAYCLGDYQAATKHYLESLRMFKEYGHQGRLATLVRYLGYLECRRGDYHAAEVHFAESQNLATKQRARGEGVAWSLIALASLAVGSGQMVRLARLLGAADAQAQALHIVMLPVDHVEYLRCLAVAHKALDSDQFERAWAEGHATALTQAIIFASDERLFSTDIPT